MEPDQWFRMWTTIGSSIGTGVTVVLGGVITYRFAIRHEQRKLLVESLKGWQKRFFEMSQLVDTKVKEYEAEAEHLERNLRQHFDSEEDFLARRFGVRQQFVTAVLGHWKGQVVRYPEPKGTPANALVLEVMAELFEMVDHLWDEGSEWPFPRRLAEVVEGDHSQCSRWIMQGLPPTREVKRRHRTATKRLKPLKEFQDKEMTTL